MSKGGSSSGTSRVFYGLLLCLFVVLVGGLWYVLHRGDDLRRARVLPGGYTIAWADYGGGMGRSWSINSPTGPMGHVVLTNTDGSEGPQLWGVTRLAIAGDVLIGTGWEDAPGQRVPLAFEIDTRTHRAVKLAGEWDADRRLAELMFDQPAELGKGWVEIDELPRKPRP